MSYKFLIVEDSDDIREGVSVYFTKAGQGEVDIDQASNGTECLDLIKKNTYDLVLLDIMLPDVSGFELCREIRRGSNCPIFFITALGNEENIIKGYDLGCDDYIVKPFSAKELYLKSLAMAKRYKGDNKPKVLKAETIELDVSKMLVLVNGVEVNLSPKEYFILKLLMENKGKVFSRDEILDKVWGYDFDGMDRVVDTQIKRLRKNLGSAGKNIVTVFGRGYKIS